MRGALRTVQITAHAEHARPAQLAEARRKAERDIFDANSNPGASVMANPYSTEEAAGGAASSRGPKGADRPPWTPLGLTTRPLWLTHFPLSLHGIY